MSPERWSPFRQDVPRDQPVFSAAPARMPGWFWLLPLLAMAIWWPLEPYWKSDDYLIVAYVRDFANVLHDFHGPEFGAADIWRFLRPMVTLSFWIDGLFGGSGPFAFHLGNVLLHAVSALLVALLWCRVLPQRLAFAAGLVWAAMPSHAGCVSWAAGRNDLHGTIWCLCAMWLLCRHLEGHRRSLGWSLLAMTLALLSKESAFALPPLLLALAFALSPRTGFAGRLRAAVAATWPHFVLFALYLGYRAWALGTLVGGYASATLQPAAMADGIWRVALHLVDPLRWGGGDTVERLLGVGAGAWLVWLGCLPIALAALHWLRRRPRAALLLPALFLLAAAPDAPFWSTPDFVLNLRYYHLPAAVLAGAIAAAGWPVALAMLLLLAAPLLDIRADYLHADRQDAAMHRLLQQEAAQAPAQPLFVAGLPRSDAKGTLVRMDFGVDRMLVPPFTPGSTRMLALRPLSEKPDCFRLTPADEFPFALPGGTTLFFRGHDLLGRALPEQLPVLPIAPDDVVDLTTERAELIGKKSLSVQLRTPGVRTESFRLTVFTGRGYLCAVFPNHADATAADGCIDMLRLFAGDRDAGVAPARCSGDRADLLILGMIVPVIADLETDYPVLIEGGTGAGASFRPTHRADHLLTFRFDRGFAGFVLRVMGM